METTNKSSAGGKKAKFIAASDSTRAESSAAQIYGLLTNTISPLQLYQYSSSSIA